MRARSLKKAYAAVIVTIMVLSAIVPMVSTDDSDAYDTVSGVLRNASDYQYEYTLGISNGNLVINTVKGKAYDMTTAWSDDGYGPFNSFYAAFDPTADNRMVCHLDPDDLTRDIRGNTVEGISGYNIMWVIPTVYWFTDANGVLHLTNVKTAGAEAYAHTIDGHTYNYLAIGVYEACFGTVYGEYSSTYVSGGKLLSLSGVAPASNQTRERFRTLACSQINTDGVGDPDGYSMLWNFYQWELYKYCSYTVMGGFDSQSIVGQGNAPTSSVPSWGNYNATQTGLLDGSGAYASRTGTDTHNSGAQNKSSVKMFIENSWGSVFEFVDGVVFNNRDGVWLSQSSNPADETSWSASPTVNPFMDTAYTEYKTLSIPSNNTVLSKVNTSDSKLWGYGDTSGTYAITNDNIWSGGQNLYVGGCWNSDSRAGVSAASSESRCDCSSDPIGARSAFVFDAAAPAAQGSLSTYSYVLSISGGNLVVSDAMDPSGVIQTISNSSIAEMNAKWTVDGYGPFNSYYAAFDPSNGNRMVCRLDPNDLTKDLHGNTVPSIGSYNIMWVLPTVYWYTDTQGRLHLSDNPLEGQAYAHTIDGKVYNYLAIGVYEAYNDGSSLKSLSGVDPASSQSRETFRNLAKGSVDSDGDGTSDGYSMLWNFYQWELYKYCSYTVMGGLDSQSIVGQGKTSGDSSNVTGLTDANGAYWGTSSKTDSVKMFIENSWGSLWEFVDGAVFNNKSGIWISQSSNPTHKSSWTSSSTDNPFTATAYTEYKALSIPSSGNLSKVNTSDPKLWGYGDTEGTSATTNDKIWSGSQNLFVGGCGANVSGAGVSAIMSEYGLAFYSSSVGARSAFVFDAAGSASGTYWNCSGGVLTVTGSIGDFSDPKDIPWIGCDIRQIVVESGCTSIGQNAFAYDSQVRSIVFKGNSLPSMGSNSLPASGDCRVIFNGEQWSVHGNALYRVDGDTLFIECNGITDGWEETDDPWGTGTAESCRKVILGNGVIGLGDHTFKGFYKLWSIDTSRITHLGDYVFSGCSSLTYLDLSGMTSISEDMLKGLTVRKVSDHAQEQYRLYYYKLSVVDGNLSVKELDRLGNETTPVSIKNNGGTFSQGSWAWDSATGLGPFGSYYATFTSAGTLHQLLNPGDLTKYIATWDATAGAWDYTKTGSSSITAENTMWVLPTVYWKTVDGSLVLSNDPGSGGEAYAHTIDGKTYGSIAIGVYEAYMDGSVLKSVSGKVPTVTLKRMAFRTAVSGSMDADGDGTTDGFSMLWNFYQWELYKYCSYTVMGGLDSQTIVGQGRTSNPGGGKTGLTNADGAYWGSSDTTVSVKMFIENSWGSVWEFVDGVVFTDSGASMYVSQKSVPTDDTSESTYVTKLSVGKPSVSSGSEVTHVTTSDARFWGYASASSGTQASTGDTVSYGSQNLVAGGSAWGGGSGAGVSAVNSAYNLDMFNSAIGARAAFVIDAAAPAAPCTVYAPNITTIGDDAFEGQIKLISVSLHKVTSVGDGAFKGCTSLETVTITSDAGTAFGNNVFESSGCADGFVLESNVRSIGTGAFAYSNVRSINSDENGKVVLDGPQSIPEDAFYQTKKVNSFQSSTVKMIETSGFSGSVFSDISLSIVTAVRDYAFSGCSELKMLSFGTTSVQSVGQYAFSGSGSAQSFIITGTLVNIGQYAFKGSNISGINPYGTYDFILVGTKSIGKGAFSGSAVTSIDIPDLTGNLTEDVFRNCMSLTNVNLPEFAEGIPDNVFNGCAKLVTFSGPKSTSVGAGSFKSCPKLSHVTLSESCTSVGESAFEGCESYDASAIVKNMTAINKSAFKGTGTVKVEGPSGQVIGEKAFSGCIGLITVDSDAVSIGEYAFEGCTSLRSIELDSLTEMGVYAFAGCSSLSNISAAVLTSVPGYSFQNCGALNQVSMGRLSTVGDYAFDNCGITKFNSADSKSVFGDGMSIGNYAFRNNPFGALVLGNNVSIGEYAFSRCTMTTIDAGNVSMISSWAFSGCTSLNDVTVNDVGAIATGAFKDCNSMKTLNIGDVQTIDGGAFEGCIGLTVVNAGKVATLSAGSFENCIGLKTFSAEYVKNIGSNAFKGCSSLTKFTDHTKSEAPDAGMSYMTRTESIGTDAFSGTAITSLCTASLKSLSVGAFEGMASLTEAVIQVDQDSTLNTLPDNTFKGCTSLQTVHLCSEITGVGNDAFPSQNMTVYWCSAAMAPQLPSNVTVISSATAGVSYANVTLRGGDPIQIRRVIQGSKFVLPYGASGESVDTVLALKDSDGNRKELTAGRSGDVLIAYTQNSSSMSFETDDPAVTNGFEVKAIYEGEGQPLIGKTVQWTVSNYGQTVELPVPADVEGSKFTNYEGTVSKKVFKDGDNETIQNPIPVVMTFYESSFELMSDSAEYTVRFEYNKSVDVGKPAVEKVYKKGDPIATVTNPLPETVEVLGYVCLGWCYSMDPSRPVQNSDQVLKNTIVYLMFEEKDITMTIRSSYNEDVLATVTSKQYVDVTVYNRGDANGGKILVTGNDVEISGDYYEKGMGNLFDSSKYANEYGYAFRMVNVSTSTTVPRSYGDSDSPGQESTGRIYDGEFTITVVFEPKKYDIVFESYMLGTSSAAEDGPDKSTIKIDGKTYAGGKYKTGLNHKQIQAGVAFPIQKISVTQYSFSELKMYSGTTYIGTYNTSSTPVLNIDDAVFGSNTVVTLKLYFETGKYVIRYDTTDCSSLTISNSPALSDKEDVSYYNYKIPDGSEKTRGYTFKGWVYKDINGEEHDVTEELAASGNRFSEGMKEYGNRNDMFIDFYAKWDLNKYAVKYIITDQNGDEIRSGLSETTISINQTFPSSFKYDDGGVSKTMELSDVRLDYHDLVGWTYTYGMMIGNPVESKLTGDIIAYVSSDKPVVGEVHTSGTVELTTVWEETEYTLVFNTGSTSIEYRYDSQTKVIDDLFTVPDAKIIASMYPLHTLSEEPCWTVSKDELPILRFQSLTDHYLDESILAYQKDGKITFTVFWVYSSYKISYSKGVNAGETQGVLPDASEKQYQIGTKFPVSPTTYEDEGKQVPYLKRVGYTLVGWNYVDGASTYLSSEVTLTEDMASIAENGRVILYPVWTPLVYRISYDFAGGSSDNPPEQVEFGVEFEISIPVKAGFKFDGWTADVDTLNTQYAKYRSGSSMIMWTGTLTRATEFMNLTDSTTVPVSMVAHWTESEYSIVYDGNYGNGGSGEADTSGASKKAFVNTEFTLAKPGTLKKPGYTFAGWSLDGVIPIKADGEGKAMFTDAMSSYANERMQVTMYAVWAVNSYKVQYKVYEGAADVSTRAYYDVSVPIGIPERNGYVFDGWRQYSVSGGTFSQYASFSIDGKVWSDWPSESGFIAYGMYVKNLTDDPGATVNLVGQWSLRDYTLVYNANGGKGSVPSESGGWRIGDTLALPEPTGLTKDGYEFAGWSMDRENRLDKTKFDEYMAESADSNHRVVLYALWSVGTYTVLCKDTSESEEVSMTVQYNSALNLSAIDRPGYEFIGWSSDDASPNVAMYSRNGESWFSWTDPTTPVVASYFKNLSSAIGGEVHITGEWEEKEYTVQYSANGGTGTVPTDSNTYRIGDDFKPVDAKDVKLEKKNKMFVGWAYEIDAPYASDISKVDEEMIGYADKADVIVLYAVWADGTYKVRMSIGDATPSSVPSGWKNTSAGVYEKEAVYGESVKEYIAEWDGVQLQLDGYKFVGWNTDQSKVLSDVTVTAMYTPVNQSNIYILVGVIAIVVILLFVVTRIERN